jgi:TPR repeat protein
MKKCALIFFVFLLIPGALWAVEFDLLDIEIGAFIGDSKAQALFGLMLYKGDGVPRNKAEGAKWLWKAAKQGFMFFLIPGVLRGGRPDYHSILKDAEQGDSKAQALLALMLDNGYGVAQDKAEGAKWLRKAAEQGDVEAQLKIGMMLKRGFGVAQDKAEAATWFRKAAEKGNTHAQMYLGNMLLSGDGIKEDKSEGERWYRKAAEKGDESAQSRLGDMLRSGDRIKEDKSEAAKWYRKAAKQGDMYAQYDLGWMLYTGEGIPSDYAEAKKCFLKCAKQGDSDYWLHLGDMDSCLNLGDIYENGKGVTKDKTEAEKWFGKAFKQVAEGRKRVGKGYNLGYAAWVFLWAGRFPQAEKFANEGLSMNPKDTDARIYLADALLMQGKNDAALAEYIRGKNDAVLAENSECKPEPYAIKIEDNFKKLKIRFPEKAPLFDDTAKALGL